MSPLAHRGVILLVCIGLLALQPEKVSGLRSIDLALKWDKVQSPFLKHLRVLKVVAVDDFHAKLNLAPAPSVMVDPNQSNKRRVRKGSDPIHNRCWHAEPVSFTKERGGKGFLKGRDGWWLLLMQREAEGWFTLPGFIYVHLFQ